MEKLYLINKVLVIINVILGFTIFLGLYFLIILGIAQILMSLIIAYNKKQLTEAITQMFNTYSIITAIILTGILLMYCKIIPSVDLLVYIGLIVSVIMAFLHLYITYLIHKL